eukprot:TRINITY_DN8062_c0_g1_i4.p1 TRINITY_DN8062_c0_g1~~TRINITY_DN8062_c0_g1_i4.p1  ORF type:complete len:105 (+),score=8.06 TRINITY_DN8062_c0_g1_i4:74-388(+)
MCIRDRVYTVHLEQGEWTTPILCGATPTPRFGQSMTNLGDSRLLFFGGCTDRFTYKDVALLDLHLPWALERWLWKGQRFSHGCIFGHLSPKLLTRIISSIAWVD